MYKSFFNLQSNPFSTSPDPQFLCMMPNTREALAALEYGISARKGFIVLTGEVGTGKTTLLRRALASFDQNRVYTSFVFNPGLEVLDFLEYVLNDFGIPHDTRTKSGMLIQLNRWLIERFRTNATCVIAIDEAQNLSLELLEEIRLLTNLETNSEKLVQIILAGQPELERKIRQPELRQLHQRIWLWCRTQPLTEAETGPYIVERLRIAGTNESIFTPEAVQAIYRGSRGVPRIVNLICEHSLILAYVEQIHVVTGKMISVIIRDLALESGPLFGAPSDGSSSPILQANEAEADHYATEDQPHSDPVARHNG
jgi:general secretion pathway protein A